MPDATREEALRLMYDWQPLLLFRLWSEFLTEV